MVRLMAMHIATGIPIFGNTSSQPKSMNRQSTDYPCWAGTTLGNFRRLPETTKENRLTVVPFSLF